MTHLTIDPYATTRTSQPEPQPGAHPEACPCGCAPCEEPCCELECVERPRFYCGQLLGEDDLTALVDWTRARLRRARYRHGWGIVCGLNVRCDPDNPTGVILGEGYAVDCCGEDVVVCKDTPIDLADACQDEECLDPWRERAREAAYDENQEGCVDLSGLLVGAAAVDLYLHYYEQGTHPESALGGCGCGQGSSCEFSRTRETYRWSWKAASPVHKDPYDRAYQEWSEGYKQHLERLLRFVGEVQEAYEVDLKRREEGAGEKDWAVTVRRKLTRWIREHPLHHFCFVEAWLSDWQAYDLLDRRCLARLLFWLALEYRLAWLHCDCPRCDPQTGIPVARVWLQIPDYRRERKCRVLLINDWQPFRRPIQPDKCLPARTDCINLGQFLWQRRHEVEREVAAEFDRVEMPDSVDLIARLIRAEMEVDMCRRPSPQEPLRLAVVDVPEFQGERVVAFSPLGG
jgi:hypothetical protein